MRQEKMFSAIDTKNYLNLSGIKRNYCLFVPSQKNPAKPLPILFMFHGDGGTSVHASQNYGWKEKAMKEEFIVVFPEARCGDPTKPPNFVSNPSSWSYDVEGNLEFIKEILGYLKNSYSIDQNRIYLTGFSRGAFLSFRAGIAFADQIAAIGPVCGYFPEKDHHLVKKPLPIMMIVGDSDPTNPIDGGRGKASPWRSILEEKRPMIESLYPWLDCMGIDHSNFTVKQDHSKKILHYGPEGLETEIFYIVVKGQGHEWPGGPQVMHAELTGKNLQNVKATDFLWDFFKTKALK